MRTRSSRTLVNGIDGDPAPGWFFAVPFFAAVLVLTRLVDADRRTWIATVSACVLLGAVSARMPLMSDSPTKTAA